MDDQNKRAAPVKLDERPSTSDRVKQAQEIQRRMEAADVRPAAKTAAPARTQTAAPVPTVFDVGAIRGGADIKAAPKTDPAIYARAQVDPSKLFGGGAQIELTGTPWKVISFETMLPVLFDKTAKPLASYQAKVPEQAAKTDQGVLFPVTLTADGEAPVTRAVLTSEDGKLTGAECRDEGDVNKLLSGSKGLLQQLFDSAFGPENMLGRNTAKLVNVAQSKHGAFADVTLSRGGETKTVSVNNFARPIPAGVDPSRANLVVTHYFSDRFDAE